MSEIVDHRRDLTPKEWGLIARIATKIGEWHGRHWTPADLAEAEYIVRAVAP